jgi:hypothetical protein
MKEFLRPRMNLSMVILVIFAFVLIDQFIVPAIATQKVAASSEYRIPMKFTFGHLKVLIDQINEDPNPKIVLTGDSIIQGGGVDSGKESIAHFLQQELKQINSAYHVYNVGLQGAAPADVYFMTKALSLTNKDIVVYDLNVSRYGKAQKPITFPRITPQLSSKFYQGGTLHDALQLQTDKLEDHLQLLVTNTWKFYAYREVIKSVIQEKVFGHGEKQPETNVKPWYLTDWKGKIDSRVKRGAIQIAEDDVNLMFTKMLIQEARNQGANVLVFNIPLNHEMMAKYQMLDREKYDQNIKKLARHVQEEGAFYHDYQALIPSAYFTDSVHPMREGNRIIANRLYQDLQPWIERKELLP